MNDYSGSGYQARHHVRVKRLDYCRGRFSESPFCRQCGVSIKSSWRCPPCSEEKGRRKIESAHALMVKGLKAAYHLALISDILPYNGYGHCNWDDYHAIQDWIDDNAPSQERKDG